MTKKKTTKKVLVKEDMEIKEEIVVEEQKPEKVQPINQKDCVVPTIDCSGTYEKALKQWEEHKDFNTCPICYLLIDVVWGVLEKSATEVKERFKNTDMSVVRSTKEGIHIKCTFCNTEFFFKK